MWTLAEASVECNLMSGATTSRAEQTANAEQRECARSRHGVHAAKRDRAGPGGAGRRSVVVRPAVSNPKGVARVAGQINAPGTFDDP